MAFFDAARSAFSDTSLRELGGIGSPSSVPVFIVGMPRSGSTLIEQILAGHPAVFSAGETELLAEAILRRGLAASEQGAWGTWLSKVSAQELKEIGEDYVRQITAEAPASATRVIDKGLANFQLLGLIYLVLPNARIIHVHRDPLDTCVSCYSKLFGRGLGFTYDLAELGRYYVAYERLMDHWRRVLPPQMLIDVRYEDVVEDLEGQARRLLEHCGLEWDPRCLQFHDLERWVHTASAAQVRKPLYRSSIGRWRAYEPHLGPLIDAMTPRGAGKP